MYNVIDIARYIKKPWLCNKQFQITKNTIFCASGVFVALGANALFESIGDGHSQLGLR